MLHSGAEAEASRLFENVRDDDEQRRRTQGRVIRLVKSRAFRAIAGLCGAAAVLVAIAAGWLYAQVKPGVCVPPALSDLTIEEMIAIKRRVEQYERNGSGTLSLSGREASFLLADNLDYPVRLSIEGTELEAELDVPQSGTERCYHIDFRGQVAIEEGVARLTPSHLAVGDLDLSSWFAGTQLTLERDDLRSEEAGRLLSRTRHLEVVDGHLLVQIDDMRSLR